MQKRHFPYTEDEIERFNRCFDKRGRDECWEWLRGKISTGYGCFYPQPKHVGILAHRFSLELKMERAIGEKLQALHACDNPGCVNPNHLREGTSKDNARDMIERKRNFPPPRNNVRGERCGTSVMTDDIVRSILTRRAQGASYAQLKREFSISIGAIAALCSGRTWLHIANSAGMPSREKLQEVTKTNKANIWSFRGQM